MELWNDALVTTCEGQSRRRLSHLRLSANTEMLRTACFLCVIGHRELLLPSQGVQWTGIDDATARATLTDGATTVSLEFGFSRDGLITSAFRPSRYREVHGAYQPTPWLCQYTAYAEHDSMRIPLAGAVQWQLPERPLPYWRGRVTAVTYEYGR
jgi:hypothetical protein